MMTRKGKTRARKDANSETQNNETPNQINDENVEINLGCSLPSSTRASNEICSSSAPPNKRPRKVNVRGNAKGVKSREGIDYFKKFHTKKDGESWATEKAKDLWDQMDNIRSTATSEGSIVNEWEIYRNVIGEPSHGCVIGLGTGIQGKDVYGSSSSQTCSKRCKETQKMKEKEWEDRFKQMESTIDKLQQQIPVMVQAVLQSLGLSNIQLPTQGGDNDLRNVIANSQENIRDVPHGNTNEKDGNENSLEKIFSEKYDDANENEDSCEDDDDDDD
ncbi:hypothetical protein IHE45_15G103000 [Dioscorea alata]|uniref:Uncharacterized protein n=2 Tax=Dioscorea alata TaxID=55571 RepID=A0ACB7UNF1_DIOAL|nr:hypothetical protein IHE45_15G103000 [Dioscorea alata]KAH7662022.1 hypothetical protein IHE45_15G103000 [Dioscorea alata]